MTTVARSPVIVGGLLLLGLLADALARRAPLPRVTILMLLGLLAGPVVLDVLPPSGTRGSRSPPPSPSS